MPRTLQDRQPVVDTPLSLTDTSYGSWGFDDKRSEKRYLKLAAEGRKTIIGPMPVSDFLSAFLRADELGLKGMPQPRFAFADVPEQPQTEADIYSPLIIAINESNQRKNRCPGFAIRDTSNRPDRTDGAVGAFKPDLCAYALHLLDEVSKAIKDPQSRADMGYAAFFIEVKLRASMDPFNDPPPGTSDYGSWEFTLGGRKAEDEDAFAVLGQNIAYAAEIMRRQHRTCCFSVLVCGLSARLIRWDRAGAIVTEVFSLHRRAEFLCRFLWLFSRITETERGYDLTVQPASDADERMFKRVIRRYMETQKRADQKINEAVQAHYMPGHVASVYFPYSSSTNLPSPQRRLLISRPVLTPLSATGRSTRLYWAVDSQTENVILLKDTWRRFEPGEIQEGSIMRNLKNCVESGVCIPDPDGHGDVPLVHLEVQHGASHITVEIFDDQYQTSLTQDFVRWPWVCGRGAIQITRRRHYRLAMTNAGCCLLEFSGSKELLSATHDAFNTLVRAYYATDGRSHRELHPWSVVLHRQSGGSTIRRGYLINWEASVLSPRYSPAQVDMSYEVSLPWQFQPTAYLSDTQQWQKHTIYESMESMFYLVIYCGLLHLRHNLDRSSLLQHLITVFDNGPLDGGLIPLNLRIAGGGGKSTDLMYGTWIGRVRWEDESYDRWVRTIFNYRAPWHNSASGAELTWVPTIVDQFWLTALKDDEHPLDRANRVVNLDYNDRVVGQRVPRAVRANPQKATTASSSLTVGTQLYTRHTSHITWRSTSQQGVQRVRADSPSGPGSASRPCLMPRALRRA
ncbi:hypothetical protein OH76DRAFT_1102210 [Lentinus brumalis]|uniref:Fungal-type protein kinase domain-containing protein n=1 Tax=Lentinus brumalis TaxID=2498619 RepID=A0A371CVK9_9APHY|nr:hypothetical protein OH76DRAFT_1102210 [Polyporus brumalis]